MSSYKSINMFQVGIESLEEFSTFVFDMYAYHYIRKHGWSPDKSDLDEMIAADTEHFSKSFYLAYRDEKGQIMGTLKATYKDESIIFPIEKDFNLNLEEEVNKRGIYTNTFWHFGRLAINSKELRKQHTDIGSREVFRELFICGFKMVSYAAGNHMVAESDALIYDLFHEMGINMQTLGEAKYYLGSPTYPVIITSEDILSWLNKHDSAESLPAFV